VEKLTGYQTNESNVGTRSSGIEVVVVSSNDKPSSWLASWWYAA